MFTQILRGMSQVPSSTKYSSKHILILMNKKENSSNNDNDEYLFHYKIKN